MQVGTVFRYAPFSIIYTQNMWRNVWFTSSCIYLGENKKGYVVFNEQGQWVCEEGSMVDHWVEATYIVKE